MVLSYAKYIELMSALDEYSKSTFEKVELQKAIFNHYTGLYGHFVAENLKGSKRYFSIKYQQNKFNKKERKAFIKFMNEQ